MTATLAPRHGTSPLLSALDNYWRAEAAFLDAGIDRFVADTDASLARIDAALADYRSSPSQKESYSG